MAKPTERTYARYTQEALQLLGTLIRKARLERKQTAAEVAERAGISRGLLHRIEGGDPGCAVGAVFEVAWLLGIRLFDQDGASLSAWKRQVDAAASLLPRKAYGSRKPVKDDF